LGQGKERGVASATAQNRGEKEREREEKEEERGKPSLFSPLGQSPRREKRKQNKKGQRWKKREGAMPMLVPIFGVKCTSSCDEEKELNGQ
jgi:hypothetical protein